MRDLDKLIKKEIEIGTKSGGTNKFSFHLILTKEEYKKIRQAYYLDALKEEYKVFVIHQAEPQAPLYNTYKVGIWLEL